MSWFKRVLFGDPRATAAKEGNIAKMQELLDQGMDVNETTSQSDPAIFSAAYWGQTEMVDFLIENGADVDCYAGSSQNTPLHAAAQNGHNEIVKLLIKNNANINTHNKYGVTQLTTAAHFGQTEIVKLLIENGANINARNENGRTPLDYALMPVDYSDFLVKAEDKESCAALIREAGGKSTL